MIKITWKQLEPMPFSAKGHAHAVIDDEIIYYCGTQITFADKRPDKNWMMREIDKGGRSRDGWAYNVVKQTWRKLPIAPIALDWAEGDSLLDRFYLVGGKTRISYTSDRCFSYSCGTWEAMPSLNYGRLNAGVKRVGTTLFVVGGQTVLGPGNENGDLPGDFTNMVECIPLEASFIPWRMMPPYPGYAISDMALTAGHISLWMFGGFFIDSASMLAPEQQAMDDTTERKFRRHSAESYYYDVRMWKWRRGPEMPFPVGGCRGVSWGQYSIILGGIRGYPVNHPYENQEPTFPTMNFDTVVFDHAKMRFHILRDNLPPYEVGDAEAIAADERETVEGQREWYANCSKPLIPLCWQGNYGRIYPAVNIIGNKIYMSGGEVLSPNYNTTDEMWEGTVEEDDGNTER